MSGREAEKRGRGGCSGAYKKHVCLKREREKPKHANTIADTLTSFPCNERKTSSQISYPGTSIGYFRSVKTPQTSSKLCLQKTTRGKIQYIVKLAGKACLGFRVVQTCTTNVLGTDTSTTTSRPRGSLFQCLLTQESDSSV